MKKIFYSLSAILIMLVCFHLFPLNASATYLDSGEYQWDDFLKDVLGDTVDSIGEDFPLFDAVKKFAGHELDKVLPDAEESFGADEVLPKLLGGDNFDESLTNYAAKKISSEAIKRTLYWETGLKKKKDNPLEIVSKSADIYIAIDDMQTVADSKDADKSVQMFLALQNMTIAALDSYIYVAEMETPKPTKWIQKAKNAIKIGKWKVLKGGLEIAQEFEEAVVDTDEYKQFVADYVDSGGKHFGWHFIHTGISEAWPHMITWPFELYENLRTDGYIEGNGFMDWITKWMVSPYKPSNGVSVYKPNIYLYADKDISVDLIFDTADRLLTTIPLYQDLWHVEVKGHTDGNLIYDQKSYSYLFYESIAQEDLFERSEAFLITHKNREEQFRMILNDYGFSETEISDFIEFWDDFLEDDIDYLMYPQNEEIVDLQMPITMNPSPEHFFRIWFGFIPYEGEDYKPVTEMFPVIREGFYGVEWGGFFFSKPQNE